MPHYCVCERNGIGPDWEIDAASGVCSICGLAVHPADVRRTQAIAIAAITGNDPPEEPWECRSCGRPLPYSPAYDDRCLRCRMERTRPEEED